jgi:prepilin-type N-terminal cleavage/methylation domain-containing protein
MKQSSSQQPYAGRIHGFTLVELLVVISIIALLISILLPALSSARQTAQLVVCKSNIRQVSLGMYIYAQENEWVFPYAGQVYGAGNNWGSWIVLLAEGDYVQTSTPENQSRRGVFFCPLDDRSPISPVDVPGFSSYKITQRLAYANDRSSYKIDPFEMPAGDPTRPSFGVEPEPHKVPLLIETIFASGNSQRVVPFTGEFTLGAPNNLFTSTPHPEGKRHVAFVDQSVRFGRVEFDGELNLP